jgi:hypothetical protein
VVNKEREQVWQERIASWQSSGLLMRTNAIEHGFPVRQVGYWVPRLTQPKTAIPGLLPVRVAPVTAATAASISLCGERGRTLSLPAALSAAWLAELMRNL